MGTSPSLLNHTISLSTLSPTQHEEGTVRIAPIEPGMLVFLDAYPSNLLAYQKQDSSTRKFFEKIFAVENKYGGGSITDTYEVGERIMLQKAYPGDIFLTKITSVLVTDVEIGMPVYPDAGGWVREWDSTDPLERDPIGVCVEGDQNPTFPRWTAIRVI